MQNQQKIRRIFYLTKENSVLYLLLIFARTEGTMVTAVRYFSRSGNTRKLAEAVAAAVGVRAESVHHDLAERADLLFIGASVYAGGFDRSVGDFIERNIGKIGKIAVFGSSASGKTVRRKIEKLAEKFGVAVSEHEFSCYGSFLFLHGSKPDEDDLAAAASFAKKLADGE